MTSPGREDSSNNDTVCTTNKDEGDCANKSRSKTLSESDSIGSDASFEYFSDSKTHCADHTSPMLQKYLDAEPTIEERLLMIAQENTPEHEGLEEKGLDLDDLDEAAWDVESGDLKGN